MAIEMSLDTEKAQYVSAMHALEEFVKILVIEYPLVFKDGSGTIKIGPSVKAQFFPYEASIVVKKKKYRKTASEVSE